MSTLLYQGHASCRITTDSGTVIYIDPYAGEGYGLPADIVLVTHQHFDHNNVSLITPKKGCMIITEKEALVNGSYNSFLFNDVSIYATPAYNKNHNKKNCVGYVLLFDDLTLYFAGDTGCVEEMQNLAGRGIDYALLPIDGIYTMDRAEAEKCAGIIGAKHTIPIHTIPGGLFDKNAAEAFSPPNKIILAPGETLTLSK